MYDQEVWVDLDEVSATTNRTDVTHFFLRTTSADEATRVAEANKRRRGMFTVLTAKPHREQPRSLTI